MKNVNHKVSYLRNTENVLFSKHCSGISRCEIYLKYIPVISFFTYFIANIKTQIELAVPGWGNWGWHVNF